MVRLQTRAKVVQEWVETELCPPGAAAFLDTKGRMYLNGQEVREAHPAGVIGEADLRDLAPYFPVLFEGPTRDYYCPKCAQEGVPFVAVRLVAGALECAACGRTVFGDVQE